MNWWIEMTTRCPRRASAVVALAASLLAPPGAWAEETLYVSALDLSKVRQGWGQAQADKSVLGGPLVIAGQKFARGVGTHASGQIAIQLHGEAERFCARVGLDDTAAGSPGRAVFRVLLDGREAWNSGPMEPGQAAQPVEVNLHGVRVLVLCVDDGGNGFAGDHTDWAEAGIVAAPGVFAETILPEKVQPLLGLRTPLRTWTLRSGAVEYRLRQSGLGIDCAYFGPTNGAPDAGLSEFRPDLRARIEGRELDLQDLLLVSDRTTSDPAGRKELTLVWKHR